eukprot:2514024-Pleurochrysis_carterae.AAC.2
MVSRLGAEGGRRRGRYGDHVPDATLDGASGSHALPRCARRDPRVRRALSDERSSLLPRTSGPLCTFWLVPSCRLSLALEQGVFPTCLLHARVESLPEVATSLP